VIVIKRGKRVEIKPVDDAMNTDQLIYVSSANEKYVEFVKEVRKHPYKLYEYWTGKKLPIWQRLYFDTIGKLKKTDYEKQQKAINKAIKPYIK